MLVGRMALLVLNPNTLLQRTIYFFRSPCYNPIKTIHDYLGVSAPCINRGSMCV
jgi:hypothetical protein